MNRAHRISIEISANCHRQLQLSQGLYGAVCSFRFTLFRTGYHIGTHMSSITYFLNQYHYSIATPHTTKHSQQQTGVSKLDPRPSTQLQLRTQRCQSIHTYRCRLTRTALTLVMMVWGISQTDIRLRLVTVSFHLTWYWDEVQSVLRVRVNAIFFDVFYLVTAVHKLL